MDGGPTRTATELLRDLAAELRPGGSRRPGRGRFPEEHASGLRARLIAAADTAVAAGRISARDRDVWLVGEGVAARLFTRQEAALAFGLSPSRVDQIRAVVTAEVARTLKDAPAAPSHGVAAAPDRPVRAGQPGPGGAGAEVALAQLHAEAALIGDANELAVVEALRRERLETPSTRRQGASSPAQRAARSRLRPMLLGRLRQLQVAPVPLPLGALVMQSHYAPVPRRTLHRRPDPDLLARLLPAEPDFVGDGLQARARLRRVLAGYAAYPASPAPHAEAAAWALAARVGLLDRSMSAVWAAQRVAELVGPAHPVALGSAADAAMTLRVNGYLATARDLLARTRPLLAGLRADRAVRQELALALTQAEFTASPYWITGVEPPAALAHGRHHMRRLLRLADQAGAARWHDTARRRLAFIEHQYAVHEARDAHRRLTWPAALRREADALDLQCTSDDIWIRANAALTRLRFAVDVGDRAGAPDYHRIAVTASAGAPLGRFLRPDVVALVEAARRRGVLPTE